MGGGPPPKEQATKPPGAVRCHKKTLLLPNGSFSQLPCILGFARCFLHLFGAFALQVQREAPV